MSAVSALIPQADSDTACSFSTSSVLEVALQGNLLKVCCGSDLVLVIDVWHAVRSREKGGGGGGGGAGVGVASQHSSV